MARTHSFHIPVMGIGFTIDSPLKVAQYGMDSVISLVDDILLEKLRKMYSEKFEIPYQEITNKIEDFRAKRITSYLNLINKQVEKNFKTLKNITSNKIDDIKEYINMLPDYSIIKKEFNKITSTHFNFYELKDWVNENLTVGSIDVNIMTKIDKDNYIKKKQLPVEYNDAHAALRGYANSDLTSSLILSAGMNPRLYDYMSRFDDFFPNKDGYIKKKIILKVSDYRSALIQGKFLAKKGLWISGYRIESGLNCGGHAFATDGFLLGPVLEEFKEKRTELTILIQEILHQSLKNQNRIIPKEQLKIEVSAQGGVGTEEEQNFLLDYYNIDSVGWGTPFLLVPDATTVDDETLKKLAKAKEEDLYLSDISPLGVPFNSLKGNTKDAEKTTFIDKGRPGSSCPKKFVALNKEFDKFGMCTASRLYQYNKIKALKTENLSEKAYQFKLNKIVEKTCTCVGLGTTVLLKYNLDTKVEGNGVSVCPGPNMAYYSKIMSLKNITDHIYGRANMLYENTRPNMYIKELYIYIDFLQNKLEEAKKSFDKKQERYLTKFTKNLEEGVLYYKSLFSKLKNTFNETKSESLKALEKGQNKLKLITIEIENIKKNSQV